MAYLGGIHFWWPKMTGRMYPEIWGKLAALTIFVGFNLTFFPQFVLGYLGMPRRYYEYPPEFQVLNVMSTAGASILAVGYLLPLVYLTLSLWLSPVAGDNPWDATGLEWQTPSPPPTFNFDETPVVTEGPYDYPEGELVAAGSRSTHRDHDLNTPPSTATARWRTTSRTWTSSTPAQRWGCGPSWPPRSCSSAACSRASPSTGSPTRRRSPRRAASSTSGSARSTPSSC